MSLGGTITTTIITFLLTAIPITIAFWFFSSIFTLRRNTKVILPGRPIESYLKFHKASDAKIYKGVNKKISLEVFIEMYFKGDVDFNGDALEVLEWRHDWASFRFTAGLFRHVFLGFAPEVIMHTRSQGNNITIWRVIGADI